MIFFPPFNSASIAAKPLLCTLPPFRMEILAAVWAHRCWTLLAFALLMLLFTIICTSALLVAKPPHATFFTALLHSGTTFGANASRHFAISPCVVVLHLALSAAIFLTSLMASRRKHCTATQTFFFFKHDKSRLSLTPELSLFFIISRRDKFASICRLRRIRRCSQKSLRRNGLRHFFSLIALDACQAFFIPFYIKQSSISSLCPMARLRFPQSCHGAFLHF